MHYFSVRMSWDTNIKQLVRHGLLNMSFAYLMRYESVLGFGNTNLSILIPLFLIELMIIAGVDRFLYSTVNKQGNTIDSY